MSQKGKMQVPGKRKECLEAQGGNSNNVTEIYLDMSPAYIKEASEYFPEASITFDNSM